MHGFRGEVLRFGPDVIFFFDGSKQDLSWDVRCGSYSPKTSRQYADVDSSSTTHQGGQIGQGSKSKRGWGNLRTIWRFARLFARCRWVPLKTRVHNFSRKPTCFIVFVGLVQMSLIRVWLGWCPWWPFVVTKNREQKSATFHLKIHHRK